MKKFRKLIPALALLLVSAVLMSTASYAWFSMNNTVTVTGMSVTTKVSDNLLISPDTTEANFTTSLAQTRSGVLEPVSTTTGTAFFWHNSEGVTAAGTQSNNTFVAYSEAVVADPSNALANENAGKTHYDKAFNTNYSFSGADTSNVCYGYIDYVFYLKAVSTVENQKVSITALNMLYNSTAITTEKAWRVAVLSTAAQSTASAASSAEQSLISILTLSGAANNTSGKAATSTSALGDVTYNANATIDTDIDVETSYYRVTVRLYLEGEDTTCNNQTFATLTNNYTVTLSVSLGGDAGVNAIGSTAS